MGDDLVYVQPIPPSIHWRVVYVARDTLQNQTLIQPFTKKHKVVELA